MDQDARSDGPFDADSAQDQSIAGGLLDQLGLLSERTAARDRSTLALFATTIGSLRDIPGTSGAFRAKLASAQGWAAILFSSWRHRKYDRAEVSGAQRVRDFILGDLRAARIELSPHLQ